MQGQKYGRLTITSQDPHNRNYLLCICECGNSARVRKDNLLRGHVKSCGCLRGYNLKAGSVDRAKNTHSQNGRFVHGLSNHRLYIIWSGMKQRCNNPNATEYSAYGGRGIKVCPEWQKSVKAFAEWAMSNGYQEGLTIDRINNDKGYSPDNCRWVTWDIQASNKRRL